MPADAPPRGRSARTAPTAPSVHPARHAARRALAVALAAALLVGAALVARPAAAQVTAVDEGSFTVTRGGAPLGREEFRILRQPAAGGVAYVARALGAYGERRVSPALQTDSSGRPQRYQADVRSGSALEQRLTAQGAGVRFAAQSTTPTGEASREYLVPDGGLLVDDDVYHQWFALGLRRRADTATAVPVLAPRRNALRTFTVTTREATRLAVGGATLDATHLVLTDVADRRREVWLDRAGRVLRVALPDEGIVAQRDDPPR